MSRKKIGIVAGSVAAAGALIAGGAAIASAAGTPTPSASAPGQPGRGEGMGPGGNHTAASAAETATVKAAVKAKDSAVTVTSVRKDADGSYDALGTKAGANVMVEVSKDLRTVTVRTGGPGGPGGRGPGGPGGVRDTAVTGTEAAKVTAAVKAKDSAVTVTSVRKDPDGSYDALGTKAGATVMVEVSKDLRTVTVRTGGPGGPGGSGHPGGPGPAGVPAPASSTTTS